MATFFLPMALRALDRAQRRVLPRGTAEIFSRSLRSTYGRAWSVEKPMCFEAIQIQTVTGCNLSCPFCPANRSPSLYGGLGPKIREKMTDEVFGALVEQLGHLNFAGEIKPYLMNEPTLDEDIVGRVRLLREACPRASISLSTNGVLLDEALCRGLLEAGLDLLLVDDYSKDRRVLKRISQWELGALENQVVALPRSVEEPYDSLGYGLNNRAGNAPSAPVLSAPATGFCDRPFRSLYIGYDGKALLCCSDWNFEAELGDAVKDGLLAIWEGEAYAGVRVSLRAGLREGLCSGCDFSGVSTSWPSSLRRIRAAGARRIAGSGS